MQSGTHPVDLYVGQQIRRLRKERGVKQKDIATAIGVSASTLSYWESGVHTCNPLYLCQLAQELDCSARSFLPDISTQAKLLKKVATRYWVVGDFFDGTTRLIGGENGFDHPEEAQLRMDEILAGQIKPHHVDYRVEEAESLQALQDKDILLTGSL